jgi:hypothetical protein
VRGAPEPRADPKRPAPAGIRSLVDAMDLPDGGGVDPTGAIPLPIKGLDRTGEAKVERKTSVARGAQEIREKRSTTRAVLIGVAVLVVAIAGAAAWVVSSLPRGASSPVAVASPAAPATPAPAPAAQPEPAAAPAPAPVPPAPSAVPAGAAAAAPSVAPGVSTADVPARAAPAAADRAPAPVAAAPEPARAEPPPRIARADPPRPRRDPPPPLPRREPEHVAAAAPPPAAPEPAPARKKKGDSVLDFDSNDSALDEALGGGSSGSRSVYVPPAPGGNAAAQRVSDSQVNETILGNVSGLQGCVQQQKQRDPDATGVLKMRWSIAPDGSVQGVKCLTPEHASSPLSQCLTGVLRGMKFPRSASGRQDVTFPIKF